MYEKANYIIENILSYIFEIISIKCIIVYKQFRDKGVLCIVEHFIGQLKFFHF